jgi:hypothetical protein
MLVEKREEALSIPKSVPCTMPIWEMCQQIRRGIALAVRVPRSFSLRSEKEGFVSLVSLVSL